MSAKSFPPYSLRVEFGETWVVDSCGNDVIKSVTQSRHYSDIFDGSEIMRIICDGLNAKDGNVDGGEA